MYARVIKDISQAARYITEGRIVAFPTGTSYGLAGDALQGHALQRLRNLKKRSPEKSFTVCMKPELFAEHLQLTDAEKDFMDSRQHQPITMLVKPAPSLAHLAEGGTIGLRFIDHPLMQELVQAVNVPFTATSANLSDQPACRDIECILKSFPGKLDETTYDLSLAAIINAGDIPASEPSTILKLNGLTPEIIRPGAYRLSSPP